MKLANIFAPHITDWNKTMQAAKESGNTAKHLYTSGARNVLFKLEALCRINQVVEDNKKYKKWKTRFKSIEDALGEIDYLDAFTKQLEKNKAINKTAIASEKEKIEMLFVLLNNNIAQKKWIQNSCEKFIKLINQSKTTWNEAYKTNVKNYIINEVATTQQFYTNINNTFTKLEEEVHEMRRKLRWLSIYAQCYNGLIQLKKEKTAPVWSKKYCTNDVVKSPFNKMPTAPKGASVLYFNYYPFIALSFMINDLGKLKDKGLVNYFLKTEFQKTETGCKKILGSNYLEMPKILTQANASCNSFFKNKILMQLV